MKRVVTMVLILAVAAACVGLGVWQLQRLAGRKARNDVISGRMEMPAVDISSGDASGLEPYRSVRASGLFDLEHQLIRVGRPMDGIPGVVVMAPLMLDNGSAILVERGWAPSPDARRIQLEQFEEPHEATVHGTLLAPVHDPVPLGAGWPLFVRSVDIDTLGTRYQYPLLPWVLRRSDAPPIVDPRQIFRAVPVPPLSSGPHLSYAIQWFSFALIALVGGSILVFRGTEASNGRPERGPA